MNVETKEFQPFGAACSKCGAEGVDPDYQLFEDDLIREEHLVIECECGYVYWTHTKDHVEEFDPLVLCKQCKHDTEGKCNYPGPNLLFKDSGAKMVRCNNFYGV